MKAFRLILVLWAAGVATVRSQDGAPSAEESKAAIQDPRQDEELKNAIKSLDEIVVTARRFEESAFGSPASTATLRQRRLAIERGPATLPDALRETAGVMVQKTGPGLGSPFIRGFTGFRTVLLVDGIRINHSAFRDGPNQYWATVDPLSLGRLELLKGPGSVLYGSDAAGGTVAAFTEELDLGREGEGLQVGGRVYFRYDSAENSQVGRLSVVGSHEGRFAFQVGSTYKSFGDIDAGGDVGRQRGLGYDDLALDAKIQAVVHDDLEFDFLFQSVRVNNVPRAHSTTKGVSFHGTTVGSDRQRDFDQDRDLAVLTARLYDRAFFDEAEFKVAFQSQDEVQDRIRSNGRRDKSGFDLDTLAVTSKLETRTGAGRFVYGVDLYADWISSFRTRFDPVPGTLTSFAQGPVADDSTYLTLGIFVEDTLELGDWGEVTIGGRYSHIEVDADTVLDPSTGTTFSLDETYDIGAASVRLLVMASDELNFFGSVGLGFRAPNLSDLTRFDVARSNEVEIPAPGLDPEVFLGFEAGVKYLDDDFRAQVSFFHTLLFDTITRRPTGDLIDGDTVVTKSNSGDGFVQGFDLELAWRICPEFTLSGQFSFVEGEADVFPTSAPFERSEYLSRLAPLSARFSLVWRPPETGFRAELSVEVVGEADKLSTRDQNDTQRIPPGGTPGYTVYDLRLSYDLDDRKSIFLHLENLTDKNYRIHGSGSQEAGFSAVVGFDLRF